VIEILRFSLRSSADEAAFVAADKRVQAEFVYQQPGLRRRTTGRGDSSEWLIVTLWESSDAADAAQAARAGDAVWQEFEAFLDPKTVRSDRFEELD
jgi:hypothetical protein